MTGELLVEGLTSRLLSAGASLRFGASVGTDKEFVYFFFLFFLTSSLFTLHWFPLTALVCTEVTPGSRARVSELAREGITEPCV